MIKKMTVDGNPYRRSGVLNSWEFLGHHWYEYWLPVLLVARATILLERGSVVVSR
jgi:hypothetical protein